MWYGLGSLPWLFGSGSSSGGRYNTPGIAGGTFGDLGPPPTFAFDEEEARRRARRAGLGALTAGMLEAYLNRGQGVGDAFAAQQRASALSYEQARGRARDDYGAQRQSWEDEAYRARDARDRENDEALRRDREAQAKAREAQMRAQEDEMARRQKFVERLPEHLRDEAYGRVGDKDFYDWVDKKLEPPEPAKPVEMSPGGVLVDPASGKVIFRVPDRPKEGEHGRWEVDTHGRQLYYPPGGGAPQYHGYVSPDREREDRVLSINSEVERRYDDWAAKGLDMRQRMRGLTAEEAAAKRAEIRRDVESELLGGKRTSSLTPEQRTRIERADAEAAAVRERNKQAAATSTSMASVESRLGRKLTASERDDIAEILANGGTLAQVYQLLGVR